jgi:H+-transporting ATPase
MSSSSSEGGHDPEKAKAEEAKKNAEGATKVKEALDKLGLSAVPENGLNDAEVAAAQAKYGRNELPKKNVNPILRFLSFMWNPLSWAMETAAIIAIGLVDYIDFILIVLLLLINSSIGYYEEAAAGDAIAALESALAPQCKCKRNGKLIMDLQSSELVPGDVIQIRLGDVIPADIILLKGGGLKIDQAALTGESIPSNKKYGDIGFSGATVVQGEQEALVTAIGTETFFGKAVALVAETGPSGHFQTVLKTVGYFCIVFIVIWVFVELVVQFAGRRVPCSGVTEYGNCQVLQNILILIVGGIPIAMPTVLSVTMAVGAGKLAERDAIVKRLTAVEEMAGMDILCSDKTGTLTLNKLSVYEALPYVKTCSPSEIAFQAALAASSKNEDAIDYAILNYLKDTPSLADLKARYDPAESETKGDFQQLKYYPFDPVSKVTRAKILSKKDGVVFFTMKGAPQVVLNRAKNKEDIKTEVEAKILELALGGYRCLGVARSDSKGKEWEMTGLIPLFDPPRPDTKVTVERIESKGLSVKMVTGDQTAIAITTCKLLGMNPNVLNSEKIRDPNKYAAGEKPIVRDCNWMTTDVNGNPIKVGELCLGMGGFAQVYPEDKYNIVMWLQEMGHVVGMTGDGVNDAPALAKADIGIAVDDATDAARGAADIVLSSPGLSVIVDAIIGARKIFQRMKNYCMYSIHNCVRITLTFGILTVAFDWYFPTIAIVLLAIFNDGCMLSVSKDCVLPSEVPDNWNLHEIFGIALVLGLYNAASTISLFLVVQFTDVFTSSAVHLPKLDKGSLNGLLYLQVSISSMATIFVTRSRGFSWRDKPGNYLLIAFCASQTASSFLGSYGLTAQYPLNGAAMFGGCGWGWVLVAWVWSLVWYFPLDILKFIFRAVVDRRIQSWSSIWNTEERYHDPRDDVVKVRSSFDEKAPPPKGGMTAGNAPASVS